MAPSHDLWIAGATDPFSGRAYDLGVRDGVIAHWAPAGAAADENSGRCAVSAIEIDGTGFLVLPGLVETHIHLDKAFLSERLEGEASSLSDAIAMTAALKPGYTAADIRERSDRVLRRACRAGVTLLRAQVEIDPILGLRSLETALALREERQGMMRQQLVAFPQEGIFNQPGTADLMREAVRLGVDAIGGIPYNDRDPLEHLAFVFELAASSGLPLDLHLDFSDNPRELTIRDVIRLTRRYGMQGRVAVGHLTSLGSVPADEARRIAAGIAEAEISVFYLPATDLYLNGRGDTEHPRRGLTPVRLLMEAGARVCFGSNNVRNAFTPFGTGDPLDIALLLAQTAYLGSASEARRLLAMCTTEAAAALGVKDWALAPGRPAEFLLVQAADAQELLYDRPRERHLFRQGRFVNFFS